MRKTTITLYLSCILGFPEIVVNLHAEQPTDSLVNVAFHTVDKRDLLGSVSSVNIADLMDKNYETGTLGQLKAFVGGYNGNIWGQSPLVIVDGVPRSANDISPSMVETVSVLKGASAVALYGSKGAKGVILITTKRGAASKKLNIDVRANTGLYVPKAYPCYLNSGQYMALYNEACRNDGLPELYTESQIYNTLSGSNPYRYPDIDFYSSKYLRKVYNKSDLTAEIYGGNQRATYYSNFSMTYNNSLLKYGGNHKDNALSMRVRANIDINLADWLKASADAATNFTDSYTGANRFWSQASTLRPNRFSPWIPVDMIDPDNGSLQSMVNNGNVINGGFLPGGLSSELTNTFSDMTSGAYSKGRNRAFLFNVSLKANLDMLLKGLSFMTAYSVDYNDYYTENYTSQYAVYEPVWARPNGEDMIVDMIKYNIDKPSTNETIGSTSYSQLMSFRAQFDYHNSFGLNDIYAALLGWGYQRQDSNIDGSTYHRLSNANLGMQLSYNFAHKYYADFTGAIVHSAKLAPQKRNAFSPTVTLGWRISDEDFFRNNLGFINNLKVTASYGKLHQDLDISDYYMYMAYYNSRAFYYTYNDEGAGGWTPASVRGANSSLGYVTREEFRVGLEASMLNNLVMIDANYFNQNTGGLLTQGANTFYPSFYKGMGSSSFLPYINFNRDKRQGVDFTVNLQSRIGSVDAQIGFAGMYYTSKALTRDEIYTDEYQYREGRPLDASFGYVCEGYYQSQEEIDSRGVQHTLGEVKPGDLRYKDVNGDNIIDSRDMVQLGKSGSGASPFTFGVNLMFHWKGFSLFAYGTGQRGAVGYKNSSYYHVKGSGKYSEIVVGRWTEKTKETATYPRLTTLDNGNNFQNSTYWLYKTDRFDLNKVQITYDLPDHIFNNSFIRGLSVYVSGESLLTISKERQHMELNIGSAPQCRFYNLGVKASF